MFNQRSTGFSAAESKLMNTLHSIRLVAGLWLAFFLIVSGFGDEQRQKDASRAAKPGAGTQAKVDLNTADVKALAAIPVIGAEAAQAIVAARPFTTIDELDRVKGLTAEQLEQIRGVVTVATVQVPVKVGPAANTGSTANRRERDMAKVDLNTSDLSTLAAIPSVGPETARAIVAARPFKNLDDLSRVKDITSEQLEQIRAQVKVEPRPEVPRKASGERSK